jgi:AcrR family transcriptional regulator
MKSPKAKTKGARKKTHVIPDVRTTDLNKEPGTRRAEILAIATKLFAEKGFQATSIREIANAAGILSGSLYYHFDTKEDMLHEIIKDYASYLRAGYEKCAASASNARSSPRGVFDRHH